MKKAVFALILSLILLSGISGCSEKKELQCSTDSCSINERVTDADFAASDCEKLCNEAMKTKNLSSECLGDPLSDTNWVCDIAHSPRVEEDNLKENQCQSYMNGTSKRFVELTPECKFIRLG